MQRASERNFTPIEMLIELEADKNKIFRHNIPCGDYLIADSNGMGQVLFYRFDKYGDLVEKELYSMTVFIDFDSRWYEVKETPEEHYPF